MPSIAVLFVHAAPHKVSVPTTLLAHSHQTMSANMTRRILIERVSWSQLELMLPKYLKHAAKSEIPDRFQSKPTSQSGSEPGLHTRYEILISFSVRTQTFTYIYSATSSSVHRESDPSETSFRTPRSLHQANPALTRDSLTPSPCLRDSTVISLLASNSSTIDACSGVASTSTILSSSSSLIATVPRFWYQRRCLSGLKWWKAASYCCWALQRIR